MRAMEGFVRFMQARALSRKTIDRRMASLRSFERTLGGRHVLEATAVDIEDWLATLRSPATKAHYRSDLNVFFRWALRRDLVEKNPVLMTEPVRTPRSKPRPLPGPAIATAVGVSEPSTRLAIMLGAYAGLRVGEIARLHSDDVRLGPAPVLTVRNGKGGKDRVVPLHPWLVTTLSNWPAGWVFPNPEGDGPLAVDTMRRKITAAFRAIDVAMTCHQLRTSFASELARIVNGNLLLVAHVLGHESVVTTQGYTAYAQGPEAEAIGQLAFHGSSDPLTSPTTERMVKL